MNNEIKIKSIIKDNKTFIIAELSANHKQDIEVAKKTIKSVFDSGADAIKIQTYTADTMTININNDYFCISGGTIWDGRILHELYQEAYTPWEWHQELKEYAESLGLIFFSTPFDFTAVDFLENLNVPLYKIASFEITDIPLIEYTASKGKPMIISTGIATLEDIEEAVKACKRVNNHDITLLQCTSSYPAPIDQANLVHIQDMKDRFNVKTGLSDHTLGSTVAIAAVALGASVIEKHYILDRNMGGPDSSFSMEPHEFKEMVKAIRDVEKAIGIVDYSLTPQKKKNRKFSRSLFVVKDIKKGELFSVDNVKSIRPGDGLPPKFISEIIGKKSTGNIYRGTPLNWSMVDVS